MLGLADIVAGVARRLEARPPEADGLGRFVFELADGLSLALLELPGDGGMVAWTIMASAPGAGEAEAAAARLLRLRLARLRRSAGLAVSRDEDGGFILYARLRPDREAGCMETVSGLLNEAEMLRKHLKVEAGSAGRPAGGAGLFSGVSALGSKRR